MAADDRGGILVDVDGDAGAQLLEGQAALARLSVAHGEVGVVDVGLVHPDDAAQHDPVQVAGYRGEHAVPPLEGRLVGDAAQLGRALDGDVVAHEPDEGDPGRGGGLRRFSRAVPVREVNLLPQRRISSTTSQSNRDSSAVRPATSALKGFALPIWICPIRPNAHLEGLSSNKDPGGCSDKFSVWLGRA